MYNKNLELYHLLKSMSSTEKAYFKKFGFKYIKEIKPEIELFNIINKQLNKQVIDADINASIKEQFENIYPNLNYVKLKNNLFKRLLESLSEYDKKEDNRAKILQQYNETNVLLKRNLPKAALRIINKTKENILQNEDSILGILFDELEFICAVMLGDKDKIKDTYISSYKYFNELESQLKLNGIYEQVYHLHRIQGVDREGKIKDELSKITPEIESLQLEGKSYKFKFNYYSLLKVIAYLKNDNESVITALEKMVTIVDDAPHIFKQKDKIVIGTYADLINHEIEKSNNNYYFNKYYDIIKNWETSQSDIASYAKTQAIRSKIASLTLEQNYLDVSLLEDEYLKHKNDFSKLLQLAVNDCFILSFYCINNYKKVIQYANYQFENKDLRMDIQLSTEFIILVIYFEEQQFDILQNSIKSIENRMKNKPDSILKNEKIILNFFKNNISPKKKPAIDLAQKCLEELKENKYKALSNSFDFIVWFQSLINKTSYVETLKS